MSGVNRMDFGRFLLGKSQLAMVKPNLIMMKQPELGHKILELRKAKGFTQEELVERCNINVRTIQRIEAGEVTPRSYTLKTILEVLDYDFNQMNQEFNWHEKNAIQPTKHFSRIMNLAF